MIASAGAALLATLLSAAPLGTVQWGNELTLPAQRHVVRVAPPGLPAYWLVAIQRDGVDGHGLAFFRGDDAGSGWRFEADLQPDWGERDTADLVEAGSDVAVVWSYESSRLSGSTRHDVWFQWWRLDPVSGNLLPEPAVRVLDSTSSTSAYSRAVLALDSAGRVWVMAFRLESDGSSTVVVSVSTDGGAHFAEQPALDHLPYRGGGRLLPVGERLLALYDAHGATGAARFRVRDDAAPLPDWTAVADAFPEGIYHGAALSAVPDGVGGADVVYKDKTERLRVRHFDGSAFAAGTTLIQTGDWALQPAITRAGGATVIFYNRPVVSGSSYVLGARVLEGGVLGAETVVDGSTTFKCYPGAPEALGGAPAIPVLYAAQPADGQWGEIVASVLPWSGAAGTPAPPPPPPPPSTPPPSGTVLFHDAFDRTGSGLGLDWAIRGGYAADGNAASTGVDTPDRATAIAPAPCADCVVEALVREGPGLEAGVFLRGTVAGSDRYDLILRDDGELLLRRLDAGHPTVLASAPSGVDRWSFVQLELEATGAGPVSLVAWVDGVPRLAATDASASAHGAAGLAGLWTYTAGVRFDDFTVRTP